MSEKRSRSLLIVIRVQSDVIVSREKVRKDLLKCISVLLSHYNDAHDFSDPTIRRPFLPYFEQLLGIVFATNSYWRTS